MLLIRKCKGPGRYKCLTKRLWDETMGLLKGKWDVNLRLFSFTLMLQAELQGLGSYASLNECAENAL